MNDTTQNLEASMPAISRSETPSAPAYANKRKLFAAAVILQVVMLVGLGYQPMNTLAYGKVVTFQTVPVDPWDMFRGDYVILSYPFSSLQTSEHFTYGQRAYAVLRKDATGHWQAARVEAQLPVPGPDEIVLAGKVESSLQDAVRLRYGIEQVFVAEGRGRDIRSGSSVEADVAVDAEGRGIIKEVRHNKDVLYSWRLL